MNLVSGLFITPQYLQQDLEKIYKEYANKFSNILVVHNKLVDDESKSIRKQLEENGTTFNFLSDMFRIKYYKDYAIATYPVQYHNTIMKIFK